MADGVEAEQAKWAAEQAARAQAEAAAKAATDPAFAALARLLEK